ncbi:response regulator [bacterium]|nr:response regulator [bacterium]
MNPESLKILIVEDEAIIAEDLKYSLIELGYQVIGTCASYEETMELLDKEIPDFLILDIIIDGPRDGIALAADIGAKHDIPFIFLTSHADKATVKRAKSVAPNGYLIKPFEQKDLYSAIEIGISNYVSKKEASPESESLNPEMAFAVKDSLFIRDNYAYIKITFDSIRYIQSDGNYLHFFTNNSKILLRSTLKEILNTLPSRLFFRVNRSYIVNMEKITAIHPSHLLIDDAIIPINKELKAQLLSILKTI